MSNQNHSKNYTNTKNKNVKSHAPVQHVRIGMDVVDLVMNILPPI
jgi:hypothetical protein